MVAVHVFFLCQIRSDHQGKRPRDLASLQQRGLGTGGHRGAGTGGFGGGGGGENDGGGGEVHGTQVVGDPRLLVGLVLRQTDILDGHLTVLDALVQVLQGREGLGLVEVHGFYVLVFFFDLLDVQQEP